VPGEVRRLRLEAVNSTAISVQWQPPLDRDLNGVIRGYQIHYTRTTQDGEDDAAVNGTVSSHSGISDTMNGTVHETVVAELQPETEYRVYVVGYTRRGDGRPSRVKRVRTKGAGWFLKIFIGMYVHPVPKKRPTLSFAVTLTCLHQNGQHLAHKRKKLRATKRT